MSRVIDDPVEAGRAALERHAWQEAFDRLSEADRARALSAEGLNLLADAAWWSAHPDVALDAFERAYGAYLEQGDRRSAAMAAFELARQNAMRMSGPLAGGWLARAERLVADDPDAPVHGWLAWMRGLTHVMSGNLVEAVAHYDQAVEFAERTGDPNVRGIALYDKGYILCAQGKVAEGLALMDEVMVGVVADELNPTTAGYVYCGMIAVCSRLGDYGRAAEWTLATTRWCERYSIEGFPGICRVHRAELIRLRGNWSKAEEQARLACEELPRFNFLSGLGYAYYEIGEVRRRMGDLAGAEDAYSRAHEFGHTPHPGLSLVRLAQGKVKAASDGVRQALSDAIGDIMSRTKPLAAQVEISIAAGDLETAASAAEELESIVKGYETTALKASAGGVRGTVRLAQGDAAGALTDLHRARQGWQTLGAPYEVAEIRVLLAKAHLALGNEEAAVLEARAARESFERLGARVAAQQVGELLGELAASAEQPERVRRAFMFTDIVKSTDLLGVIGDDAWEDLLTWHDLKLRSLFASHGGEVVHHTGDGFFAAFEDADAAVRCAIAIQRALADHRRAQGFAPQVRIGVHAAEATRRGHDYGGGEVHKAARIAAAAGGGEILASAESVSGSAPGFAVGEAEPLALKGIADPVPVVRVQWRSSGIEVESRTG